MSANTTKALFRDALYLVLDNRAFRVLAILVGVLILPTFLVGATEDSLVILFGWKEYFYEDFFPNFDLLYIANGEENHVLLIQTLQSILVDGLAGSFGIIFAIAATAFFLPNMVEKGSADTVFSKPVSRLALMLSRYVAGLIFVSILAILLVLGIHTGLLLNCGYSDPGFLWSALTLIYLFAILHAFSILVGVFTRSSVAAILLSLIFFAFNGCVHGLWKAKEMSVEVIDKLPEASKPPENPDQSAPKDAKTLDHLKEAAFVLLDTFHYALPKTTDADLIAQKLRRTIEDRRAAFYQEESGIKVMVPPEGFSQEDLPSESAPRLVRWTLDGGEGSELARIDLSRHKSEGGSRSKSVKARKSELSARGITDVEEDKREQIAGTPAHWLSWTEAEGERILAHRSGFFSRSEYIWELEFVGEPEWMKDPAQARVQRRFCASITFQDTERHNPFESYERRASWSGPLKYNLTFSVASSLAFVLALLALGWWRLSRIDF